MSVILPSYCIVNIPFLNFYYIILENFTQTGFTVLLREENCRYQISWKTSPLFLPSSKWQSFGPVRAVLNEWPLLTLQFTSQNFPWLFYDLLYFFDSFFCQNFTLRSFLSTNSVYQSHWEIWFNYSIAAITFTYLNWINNYWWTSVFSLFYINGFLCSSNHQIYVFEIYSKRQKWKGSSL